MSRFGTNTFVALKALVSPPGEVLGTVAAVESDGSVRVTMRGGGERRLTPSQTLAVGNTVKVQGDGLAVKVAAPSATATINLG